MSFLFHPEAEAEFWQAVDYYAQIRPELGHEFAMETYAAIERATEFPEAWSELEDGIRRSLLNRFPYGILYYQKNDGVVFIVAVAHLHRVPDYWRGRYRERE